MQTLKTFNIRNSLAEKLGVKKEAPSKWNALVTKSKPDLESFSPQFREVMTDSF